VLAGLASADAILKKEREVLVKSEVSGSQVPIKDKAKLGVKDR
jgi:hypothetical protein